MVHFFASWLFIHLYMQYRKGRKARLAAKDVR